MRRLLLILGALMASLTACGSAAAPHASSPAAAERFLARYLASDGRVIRHDQGGDIVSEGQAYGMLIAEAAHQPAVVRSIWSWTNAHLRQSDGLFAWHATGNGQIEDPQSATDADVLIAYALLRYQGPAAPSLHRAGRGIAEAVLANEAVPVAGGPLPVAGPWARSTTPPTVNPSYLMPGVFDDLAGLTGDHRWAQAAAVSASMVGGLTGDGARLPSDWAVLQGGRLVAAPAPGGGTGVQYGLDAQRVPVWFATACETGARSLAGKWWPAARKVQATPLGLIAASAAATAAGDAHAATSLQARAETLAQQSPTYYGDAWAALGPALLNGTINQCQGTPDG